MSIRKALDACERELHRRNRVGAPITRLGAIGGAAAVLRRYLRRDGIVPPDDIRRSLVIARRFYTRWLRKCAADEKAEADAAAAARWDARHPETAR